MTYRDDRESLVSRVAQLERDLAAAKEIIARLQGERATASVHEQKPQWFLGAPTRLALERELPFEVSDVGFEAIANLLRQRLPLQSNVAQVGRTLTYGPPTLQVKVSRTGTGRTVVSIDADHRSMAVLLGAATPGATILTLAPIAAALAALRVSPAAILIVLPLLTMVCFLTIRALVARSVQNSRRMLVGVMESITNVAEEHATRTRVGIVEGGVLEAGVIEPASDGIDALGLVKRDAD